MILKGIVSSVQGERLAVILPEKNGIVTPPLVVYGGTKKPEEYKPNDRVNVVAFNGDINDCMVLGDSEYDSGGGSDVIPVDHSTLSNRDAENQHPINAITGLETSLGGKMDKMQALSNMEIETLLNNFT